MNRLISDKQAEDAFDWLQENASAAAAAKAQRERAEYKVKQVKARMFLDAEGTVAEREHKAVVASEYDQAVDALITAIEADEYFRNNRNKCDAIISAWQTCKSTERAFARVA